MIYDKDVSRYMVYFTLQRLNDNRSTFNTYYAYTNYSFTDFVGDPKLLFEAKNVCIDNDLVMGPDGKWHLFYKGNTRDEHGNEINNNKKSQTNSSHGLSTGEWHTLTVVQKNTYNYLYIDGEHYGTSNIEIRPSNFASSAKQSWLGRSPYESDAYMTNTMMDNLRIYNKALTKAQVKELYESRPSSTAVITAINETKSNKSIHKDENPIYNLSGQRIS